MNDFDLRAELNRNESERKIVNAELEASRNKWADYVMKNKDKICTFCSPVIVKKKTSSRFKELINKIKFILGLKRKEESRNGIEAYLQYSDSDK